MSDWHLDKKLNLGHLVTTVVLALTAFGYINAIDKKIEANAINIEVIKEQQVQDVKRFGEQRKEDIQRVEKRLDSINTKLDKLLSK